ncbi:hypothetical protein [Archaeoglobus sp.]
MSAEKSSKDDTRFQKALPILFLSYLFILLIGFFVTLDGIMHIKVLPEKAGNLIITTVSVGVTVIMVYFIALQTIATRDMVKKTSAQAQLTYEMVKQMIKETALMNESLLEMKKQRLNIEEFKNSLIDYVRYLSGTLKANSMRSGNYEPLFSPYLYLSREYHLGSTTRYLPPSYQGLILRISRVIEKFLEAHEFSLQEFKDYNKLISKFKDSKTPRHEKPGLVRKIQKKSQELLKIAEDVFQEIEKMGDQKLEEEILRILESSKAAR